MADFYGPFGSAAWSETDWGAFAPTWAPSGPVGSVAAGSVGTGSFSFTATGLSVSIGTGSAWVRGFGLRRTTAVSHAVTANTHATWSRRDRIVLRRDLTAGTVTTAFKAGTAAATPTAPALTQVDTGIWEETLFSFLTPPNSGTSITGVVDERNWTNPDGTGNLVVPTPTSAGQVAPKSYVDSLKPKFMRAQRNVDTPLSASGSWTPFTSNLNWGENDVYGLRSTGATWIAPGPGWMHVTATIYFEPNATGIRGIRLQPLDGQGIGEGAGQPYELAVLPASPSPHTFVASGSHDFDVLQGQRVQLEGYQSSGGSLIVRSVRMSGFFVPA